MELLDLTSALLTAAILTGCTSDHSDAGVDASSSAALIADTYVTPGGWGELRLLEGEGDGHLRFELDTESSGQGCSMAGAVSRDLRSVEVPSLPDSGQCDLTMRRTGLGIEIGTSSPDACDAYCGSNGSYRGEYLRVDSLCSSRSLQAALQQSERRSATSEEDGKAISKLGEMLEICGRTLSYSTTANLRTQIAIARERTGDKAGCLAVLSTYADAVAMTDEDATDGMSPATAEEVIRVLEVVRPLMARCEVNQ